MSPENYGLSLASVAVGMAVGLVVGCVAPDDPRVWWWLIAADFIGGMVLYVVYG